MKIKKVQQMLKALANDTRLRIVNLLKERDLSVTEICEALGKNQSNISKHLTRLRLTEVVGDRREGNNVYYFLLKHPEKARGNLVRTITQCFSDGETFIEDIERLGRNSVSAKN